MKLLGKLYVILDGAHAVLPEVWKALLRASAHVQQLHCQHVKIIR